MVDNMEMVTKSAQETFALGEKLANTISFGKLSSRKNAAVICLYGDLGAGKTTFVQGLAFGLGIKQRVLSPTFVFIRPYTLDSKPFRLKGTSFAYTLYHIDLYRLQKPKDARGLGLKEILNNPTNIVVIEWAEKIRRILPSKRIEIKFENLGKNERRITTSD